MHRPEATERQRDLWSKHPMTKEKVHSGTEVVREAYCYTHSRQSSDFWGVNNEGWLFKCRGERNDPHSDHWFVAMPAKGRKGND